jgi:hypothetical protein
MTLRKVCFIFFSLFFFSCSHNNYQEKHIQYECYKEYLKSLEHKGDSFISQNFLSDTSFYREFGNNSNYRSEILRGEQIRVYIHSIFINNDVLALEMKMRNPDSLVEHGNTFVAIVDTLGEPIKEIYPVFVSYDLKSGHINVESYYDFYSHNPYNHEGFDTEYVPVIINRDLIDSLIIYGLKLESCQE